MLKDIPGFPDYAVTDGGAIWSKPRVDTIGRRQRGTWLKPYIRKDGHASVNLFSKYGQKAYRVHRLVLEAFVGPCPEGMEACHNNGDPADNRLENLRWDTRQENQKDAVKHGSAGGFKNRGRGSKLTAANVLRIADLRQAGFSLRYIAGVYGVSQPHISAIAHRQTWRHLWVKK